MHRCNNTTSIRTCALRGGGLQPGGGGLRAVCAAGRLAGAWNIEVERSNTCMSYVVI